MVEFLIDGVHTFGIDNDKQYEDVDCALMGHPESKRHAEKLDFVENLNEENAAAVRDECPHGEELYDHCLLYTSDAADE